MSASPIQVDLGSFEWVTKIIHYHDPSCCNKEDQRENIAVYVSPFYAQIDNAFHPAMLCFKPPPNVPQPFQSVYECPEPIFGRYVALRRQSKERYVISEIRVFVNM